MNKQTNTLRRASLLSLAITCATTSLVAEEIEADAAAASEELVPYVVVATRTPLGLDRVSPSVSYIGGEEIEFWQDRSLTDVLLREAGMVVVASGAKGAQTSLFTRGTNSDHTAFFLDGRRLNAGFGNQYNLENLSVSNLSSVQIQKGASSVNYGSSGIGGVVDLRSRSAFDSDGANSSVGAEFGSNDYIGGSANTSFTQGDLGVTVSGSAIDTDNERKNDHYRHETVSSRVDYLLTDTLSLEFVGQYDDAEKELPGSTANPTPYDEQESENWLVSPGIRYATDELTVHLFYSYSENRVDLDQVKTAYDDFWNNLGDYPVSNYSKVESDEVNLQADYSVTDDLLLTSGVVYRNDQVTNSNLNTYKPLDDAIPYDEGFEQVGMFAQALWIIGDLELRGGVRYDDYSDFDDQMTGNFETIYTFSDWNLSLFAKVASSYAPPSAADLAFDYADAGTDLDPEKSDSYEIGFRHELCDGDLKWSVLYFHNDIDDLIGYEAIEVAPWVYEYDSVNIGSATTEGVEVSAAYALTQKLDLSVGYTYLTATNDDDDIRLVRRPRHMLQLSADYQFTDTLRAGIQSVGYFDREDIDAVSYAQIDQEDSFVVNLVADWQVTDQLTVFARAENLLDESYEPANGYPALGATGYIGARLSF
jgi:vitamin B12 transporter